MSVDFDADLLGEMASEAPQAGYGPNINFGKLTVNAQIVSWKDTSEKDANGKAVREAVTRPLKKGDKADQSKGEYIDLTFVVDIQEFNTSLDWTYERTVSMKVNGPRTKTDWSEITLPSLLATFGDDWAKKILKSPYVAVEDVDNVNGKTSKKGRILTAPKFIAAYKNKADCERARAEKYSKSNGEASEGISEDIINGVKTFVEALGNDLSQAEQMLDQNMPYGKQFTGKQLLQAAGFEVK